MLGSLCTGSRSFSPWLHEGNNILAIGSIIYHYATLLSASQSGGFFSVATAAKLFILRDLVLVGLAMYGMYLIYRDGIDVFR
jgi:hypothetical protein